MGFLPAAHLWVGFVEGMAFSPKPTAGVGACEGTGLVLRGALAVLITSPYL